MPVNRNALQTRDRLLKAALEVFSSEGVVGATTREIARIAGVNEVTLFRHFRSKEQLLGAVALYITGLVAEALEDYPRWTEDLREDLLQYARFYDQMLENHQAIVRTFIAEAQRYPQESLQILHQYFLPLREKVLVYLHHGVVQGTVRSDLDLILAVDQFTGMLLAGMLRRHILPLARDYDRDRYVEASVDFFLRSLSPTAAVPRVSSLV